MIGWLYQQYLLFNLVLSKSAPICVVLSFNVTMNSIKQIIAFYSNDLNTEKRRWLRIKDALELDAEAIAGGDKSRDSVVVTVPFSVVPGADMTVAPSSKYNYNDHGMEWNNSGKNSFHCRFKYSP